MIKSKSFVLAISLTLCSILAIILFLGLIRRLVRSRVDVVRYKIEEEREEKARVPRSDISESDWQSAVSKIKGTDPNAHLNRGDARVRIRDYKGAVYDYDRAMAIYGKDASLKMSLWFSYA